MLKRKKALLWGFVAPAAVALLFIILSDGSYRSETLLMPPMDEGAEGLLTAWMAQLNLPSMVVPMSAGSMTASVLVDILESRRIAEIVIEGLDLAEWYRTDSMYEAVKELRSHTAVGGSATGMITLSVTDRQPEKALAIINAYIGALDSLNRELLYTRAGSTMKFIGAQLDEYREKLAVSRRELALFQSENGIIDFEEQIRGSIDVAAAIKIRSALAEIELEMLREFATDDAVELRRNEAEAKMLRDQLEKIMRSDTSSSVFIPLADMPQLYQRHAALQRDLEVNDRIYSFLLQRYEESRIDLARNTPSVQVIDIPRLADRRSGLPRWAVVVLAGLAGFIWVGLVLAYFAWISLKSREADEQEAYEEVLEILAKDLGSIRRILRL